MDALSRIDPPKYREIMTPEQIKIYEGLRAPLTTLAKPADLETFWTVREDEELAKQRDKDMAMLYRLNEEFREHYQTDMEIAARLKSYELAARMQLSVPEVTDFSKEPDHVKALYGIGEKETDSFGRQLLLARRLADKGVRFIQICHGGGGNGAWNSHGDIKSHAPLCRETDKPISGLIKDLKQRGMLNPRWWSGPRNSAGHPGRKIRQAGTTTPAGSRVGWREAV